MPLSGRKLSFSSGEVMAKAIHGCFLCDPLKKQQGLLTCQVNPSKSIVPARGTRASWHHPWY